MVISIFYTLKNLPSVAPAKDCRFCAISGAAVRSLHTSYCHLQFFLMLEAPEGFVMMQIWEKVAYGVEFLSTATYVRDICAEGCRTVVFLINSSKRLPLMILFWSMLNLLRFVLQVQ